MDQQAINSAMPPNSSRSDRQISITYPDKPYWPEDGLTKADMIAYYRQMADTMLPYFRDRPVTLRLFPRGIHGPAFYRREIPSSAPPWLRKIEYQTRSDPHRIELPLVDDLDGLLYLANLGSIEFHLWASHAPELDRPDWAVFDLDPGDEIDFPQVLEAACILREYLRQEGLDAYAKTSGASGLHVYTAAGKFSEFDSLREWVKSVAADLSHQYPELMGLPGTRTHSGKQIHIDYRQNSIGRNTAAPYTLRALPGASVSTPLSWEEVESGRIHPSDFTLKTVPRRVESLGDYFAPLLQET